MEAAYVPIWVKFARIDIDDGGIYSKPIGDGGVSNIRVYLGNRQTVWGEGTSIKNIYRILFAIDRATAVIAAEQNVTAE